jgi:hypothetical protein
LKYYDGSFFAREQMQYQSQGFHSQPARLGKDACQMVHCMGEGSHQRGTPLAALARSR